MWRSTLLLLFICAAFAQNSSSPAGKWISDMKIFQDHNYKRLELALNGNQLTGKLGSAAFEGTFENGRIEGTVKVNPRRTLKFQGKLNGDRIEGIANIEGVSVDLPWEV